MSLLVDPMPKPGYPESPAHPCTEESKICDFAVDCKNGDDEAQCGEHFLYMRLCALMLIFSVCMVLLLKRLIINLI